MTLILALGNPDQVIQISDRRLSSNGRLLDNESNKAGVLTCLNARMAFGFTGLARWGSFMTRDWLLNALSESGQPDFSIGGILRRLKIKADKTFSENPALRVATKTDKRLSIMFSGYLYFENPPRQGFAILTNFQNFKTGQDDIQAWDEFVLTHWTERRPTDEACTLVQRVGNWHAMEEKDVFPLRTLLLKRKPSTAIIGKAIDLIREMADRPAAQGTIGKQLSTIRVPANLQEPVESGYYSTFNKTVYYMADGVILLPDQQIAIKDAQFKAVDPEAPPLVVNKVGRNHPCPCGSGKKYKFCHGR